MATGSTGAQATERIWHVVIDTVVDGRDGSWSAEASLKEGDEVIKTLSLSGTRKGGTSWDDLEMRAAIESVVEMRLAGDHAITFHTGNNYLHDGFEWFQARYDAGGRKIDGDRVRNWERWKQLWMLTRGIKVFFEYPKDEGELSPSWDDFGKADLET